MWRAMIDRCYNPNNQAWLRYGGRGISVCQEWLDSFDAYATWALANGWAHGLQVDKDIKSKDLGITPPRYSPETCSIVSRRVNVHHSTSLVFSDEKVAEIVAYYEAKEDTFQHRAQLNANFGLTKQQLGCILARRANKSLGRGNAGVLTQEVKQQIVALRKEGVPFKRISEITGAMYNTCRAWHSGFIRGEKQ